MRGRKRKRERKGQKKGVRELSGIKANTFWVLERAQVSLMHTLAICFFPF